MLTILPGIACGYEEAVYLAKQCGFDRIWLLDEGGCAVCHIAI